MKLILEKGQQLFFTSDTHYSHSNICRATTRWAGSENLTRDFKSLDHMNDTLANNINEMVGENDVFVIACFMKVKAKEHTRLINLNDINQSIN